VSRGRKRQDVWSGGTGETEQEESMTDTGPGAFASIPAGVLIKIYVVPRSSYNKVVGLYNGELKIALTAPPVEGAANRELVEFLAKGLAVPKGSVALVSGESSRHKVVRVSGITAEGARKKLLPSD
jgi:hypothetical protein